MSFDGQATGADRPGSALNSIPAWRRMNTNPINHALLRPLAFIAATCLALAAPMIVLGETGASGLHAGASEHVESFAWVIGVSLIVADVVLPVPATIIMASLGSIYGWALGGFLAGAASLTSAMLAYSIGRCIKPAFASRILGEDGMIAASHFISAGGGIALAASRPLPLLPEAIAILAGVTKMPLRNFIPPVATGSLLTGAFFAALGSTTRQSPGLAVPLLVVATTTLWFVMSRDAPAT